MAKHDIASLRNTAAAELDKEHANLVKLQAAARAITEANEKRAELHQQIKEVKARIAVKSNEHGELARSAALLVGGTNHMPPR